MYLALALVHDYAECRVLERSLAELGMATGSGQAAEFVTPESLAISEKARTVIQVPLRGGL
jgi:hypothetical protein